MELIEKIKKDFLTAYKAKEIEKKDYLGFIKSELTRETKSPNDAYVVTKLKGMLNKTVDDKGNSVLSELELKVLNSYIPEQYSKDNLIKIIEKIISDNNLTNKRGIGIIMKTLNSEHTGMFDGKMASEITKNLL